MKIMINAAVNTVGSAFVNFFAAVENAFSGFNVLDAIDILLLTVIFFLAFSFLKSRKAGALLIGIAVCLVILFVAFLLGLEGTYFIFSSIFQIGVLALVILFQPEIRDALERVGSGSISGIMHFGNQAKKKQIYYTAIDNICSAVNDLSRTNTGALIVIERTTKLEEIVQSGVAINADVNAFLLRNLFFNKAPLHDGAVVIDEARIVAAGCLLPLTRRQDIDGNLGTRHRAAIGMSETSDAIIIVISEETGIISVAHDCELKRNYTPEMLRSLLLRKLLRESFGADESKKAEK